MTTQKNAPVIAVIGDVNEGKTSLIRAILAEAEFGIVKDEAGSTKISEEKQVFLNGQLVFYLFDNPGFEFSPILRREVKKTEAKISLKGIITGIFRRIQNVPDVWQQRGWEREQSAWQCVEHCDVVLWIIDVRKNPETSSLKDTAELLAKSKKYIIPVFNFLPKEGRADEASDDHRKEIRNVLAEYNLQSLICEYDTNRRDFHNEIDLLTTISFSLKNFPDDRQRLKSYIEHRRQKEYLRMENARLDIGDALLRTACYVEKKTNVQDEDQQKVVAELKENYTENLANFEKDVFRKIIDHWDYDDVDAVLECQFSRLNIEEMVKNQPAEFNAAVGLTGAAAGAAAGVATGAMFDVITLGAGTVVGAVVGAVAAWLGYAKSGGKEVIVAANDDLLNKLYARLIELTHTIRTRSKAVTKENNPVLKDRQTLLPQEILAVLREYGSKNRTSTLLNQKEPRKVPEHIRTQLRQFLERQIEL